MMYLHASSHACTVNDETHSSFILLLLIILSSLHAIADIQ